jgi:hypothetical protein
MSPEPPPGHMETRTMSLIEKHLPTFLTGVLFLVFWAHGLHELCEDADHWFEAL